MARVSPALTNFTGGELTPRLDGRTDFDKYGNGCRRLENQVSLPWGPAERLPGKRFICETKLSAKRSRHIPFEFSTIQAYMIEAGDGYFRFYKDRGRIVTAGVAAYNGGTAYVPGNLAVSGGVTYYCIAATTGNAPPNATYWYAQVGTIFEVPSPYLEAELAALKWTQSDDILYLFHPNHQVRKLSRSGHLAWTIAPIDWVDGPYLDENTTATTLTPSAATGAGITVTASAVTGINDGRGFLATDIGRLIRAKTGAVWGYVKVTAWTDSLHVTADVKTTLTDTSAKSAWRLGLWSDTTGYPVHATFHEERFVAGGAAVRPQRFDGTKTGDFENMTPGTADNDPISYNIGSNQVNAIRALASNDRDLMVLTAGGPFRCFATGALTPTNITVRRAGRDRCADLMPLDTSSGILYVQSQARKLRELVFAFEIDGYRTPDLSRLAEHITAGGIVDLAYQAEPYSLVWAARGDGALLGLTYLREEKVTAWHRHPPALTIAGAGAVESVASIPGDGTDELWLIVKRTIGGATKRYVELLDPFPELDAAPADLFYVDCGLTYDGAPATVISGADHLEGETVQILADGAEHPTKTVTGGAVTLDYAASVVQLGLGYASTIQPMRLEAGAQDGTAQGKKKRIDRVTVRLLRSLGMKLGRSETTLDDIPFRSTSDPMDAAPPLFSGDKEIVFRGDYETDGDVLIRQDRPLPLTVLSLYPRVATNDG